MEVTCSEVTQILGTKFLAASTTGYTLPPRIYGKSEFNLMFISFLPNEVKVNITIDGFRLTSILTTNKAKKLQENLFSIH